MSPEPGDDGVLLDAYSRTLTTVAAELAPSVAPPASPDGCPGQSAPPRQHRVVCAILPQTIQAGEMAMRPSRRALIIPLAFIAAGLALAPLAPGSVGYAAPRSAG